MVIAVCKKRGNKSMCFLVMNMQTLFQVVPKLIRQQKVSVVQIQIGKIKYSVQLLFKNIDCRLKGVLQKVHGVSMPAIKTKMVS